MKRNSFKKVLLSLCLYLSLVTPAYCDDIEFINISIHEVLAFMNHYTGQDYYFYGEDFNLTWRRKNVTRSNVNIEFKGILQKSGYQLDQVGKTITITKTNESYTPSGVVFKSLDWLKADDLETAIGDLWKDTIKISVVDASTILLVGASQDLHSLVRQIDKFDEPFAPTVHNIPLEHARATAVLESLKLNTRLDKFVSADPWTNSIVVDGSSYIQILAASYVAALDKPSHRDSVVYSVLNTESVVLAEALSAVSENAKVVSVGASQILITGLPSDVERLSKLAKQIDGGHTQVHIKAHVVMLTDDQYKELGVRFGHGSDFDGEWSLGIIKAGADPTALLSIINPDLSVDVSANKGKGLSTVLSEPSLLVKSGQDAEFIVGQEVPIKTSESVSDEGTVTDTSIERKEIGVKLRVRPVVRDEFIDLVVYQEISSLGSGVSTVDITTNTESIETHLVLADGETTIIGGLKARQFSTTKDGIPVLSTLPVVGSVFGYDSEDSEVRNIVISLTANIIRQA